MTLSTELVVSQVQQPITQTILAAPIPSNNLYNTIWNIYILLWVFNWTTTDSLVDDWQPTVCISILFTSTTRTESVFKLSTPSKAYSHLIMANRIFFLGPETHVVHSVCPILLITSWISRATLGLNVIHIEHSCRKCRAFYWPTNIPSS